MVARVARVRPVSKDDPASGLGSGEAPVFSRYGVLSAVLGVTAVVALVLSVLIGAGHHSQVARDRYDARVLDTAVTWVNTLINMKKGNLDSSVQTLQDGTVGRLSDHLGEMLAGVVKLARTVDADAAGEIDSVAIERGQARPIPDEDVGLPSVERLDRVMVVATSVTRDANAAPKVNQWHMRLAVSKVGDQLLISGLELLR
ncbi:hypothetical protein CCUG63695_04198 [Mycobacteroides franklinii]|uniref:Mammalian cell entry protein n=1 Tax=Mycobacteroides franklinii TaxID=948102 RepID=A0A4R8R809_9MYCO|nr:hypothetical protein CCUG64054_04272 [Mycobacteroides franklinii]TDZ51340.1 hypothetical protein CCUG63697_02856 [Mycobacteroides franklinii]TDZ57761.1 hypothetical protein CCUG63696_04268 [Mycobacteroides franklinii]TDZ64702.1 hypothetical protein CCUG63695_04198 [Mycobacteroides franklinii]TDZ71100.1 hypothetical protein CCUG64056_04272 [Mycobacteroides franklinii]